MLEQQGETWEVEWLAELFLCIGKNFTVNVCKLCVLNDILLEYLSTKRNKISTYV